MSGNPGTLDLVVLKQRKCGLLMKDEPVNGREGQDMKNLNPYERSWVLSLCNANG